MINLEIKKDLVNISGAEDEMDFPYFSVKVEDLIKTVKIPGFGNYLSNFVVELSGQYWMNKPMLETIIAFVRENFPNCNIDWESTFAYLEDY
jgi:hypothetical protein